MAPKPVKYDDTILLQLARDLVLETRSLDELLQLHGLTLRDWDTIQKNAAFQLYTKQIAEKWHAIESVDERIEFKAKHLLEIGLEKSWAQFTDNKEPLAARNVTFQNWMKCAGVGLKQGDAGPTEHVKINIVIGGQKISLEQEITPKVIDVTPNKKNNNGGDQL
jgi:hypothetical protein